MERITAPAASDYDFRSQRRPRIRLSRGKNYFRVGMTPVSNTALVSTYPIRVSGTLYCTILNKCWEDKKKKKKNKNLIFV